MKQYKKVEKARMRQRENLKKKRGTKKNSKIKRREQAGEKIKRVIKKGIVIQSAENTSIIDREKLISAKIVRTREGQ